MVFLLSLLGACIVNHDLYQERRDALTDNDGDGFTEDDGDCNDADPDAFPGADEYCNGTDDDCDLDVDEDAVDATRWYPDADEDGYGAEAEAIDSCERVAGWMTTGGDCLDDDALVSPDGTEVCNSIDDDCDGTVDEDATDARAWYPDSDGDGYGDPSSKVLACVAPAGMVADDRDCDDTTDAVSPEAEEVCYDSIDNNCSGFFADCQWDSIVSIEDGVKISGSGKDLVFGKGITTADIDGDGVKEIILGRQVRDEGAYLLSFEVDMSGDLNHDNFESKWSSENLSENFGYGLESADLNSDGFDDLFLIEDLNQQNRSVGYVLLGPLSAGFAVSEDNADMVIEGDKHQSWNTGLFILEDVSGDGNPEFGTSTCEADLFVPSDCDINGKTYLFESVSSNGVEGAHVTLLDSSGWGFGVQVLGTDINGDGLGELIAATPGAQPKRGQSIYDSIFLFNYPDKSELFEPDDAVLAWYGCSTCIVTLLDNGDLNNDGYMDFLIGMYQKTDSYGSVSELIVLFGEENPSDGDLTASGLRILAEDVDPLVGSSGRIHDFNNDGNQDILFGTIGSHSRDAYLFYGEIPETGVLELKTNDVVFNFSVLSGNISEYWDKILIEDLNGDSSLDLAFPAIESHFGQAVFVVPGIVQ